MNKDVCTRQSCDKRFIICTIKTATPFSPSKQTKNSNKTSPHWFFFHIRIPNILHFIAHCCIATPIATLKRDEGRNDYKLLLLYLSQHTTRAVWFLTPAHFISFRPILIFLRLDARHQCPATYCTQKNENEGSLYTQIPVYLIRSYFPSLTYFSICMFSAVRLMSHQYFLRRRSEISFFNRIFCTEEKWNTRFISSVNDEYFSIGI